MADEDEDEVPGWVEQIIGRVEPHLSFFTVGQLDVRWGDEGEVVIAPAVFQVESDDEHDGDTGFGAFEIPDVAGLAALLTADEGSPSAVSCGPAQDGSGVSLVIEGRFDDHNVWLEIQFEPFEDAEPTFILQLTDEHTEPEQED